MDNHGPDYDDSTEQTPLVDDDLQHAASAAPRRPPHRPMLSVASIASIASVNVPKVHNGNTVVFIFCAICIVVSSANGFINIPLTEVLENAVCRRYYNGVQHLSLPVDEGSCKIPAVQSKMAYIFATVEVTDAIAGMLSAFPWGIAADR
jgi:hypothetical protein